MNSNLTMLNIITSIGFAAFIGAFIYIGRKLQVLDDLKETSDKMKENLNVVCNYLIKNNDSFDSKNLKTFSPMQLTEEGKGFIEKIGFRYVFEEHKKAFFDFIDSEQPKLKYDVETAAIKSIAALSDKDYMNFLKVFFYNNPLQNFQNTAPTLGVYVRDAYLAEHPEISQ